MQQLVREFEQQHPNVDVRVQQIPWTAAHEKLLTAYVGNVTPDLAQLGNTWVPELQAVDAIEPLDKYVAQSSVVKASGVFPRHLGHERAQRHALRRAVVRRHARSLLSKGPPDAPRATTRCRSRGPRGAPQCRPSRRRRALASGRSSCRRTSGCSRWCSGCRTSRRFSRTVAATARFEDAPFRGAYEFYVGLFRDGLAPVAGNNDIANAYQEFARGTFAMWITGPWNIGEFQRRLPPDMQHSWATSAASRDRRAQHQECLTRADRASCCSKARRIRKKRGS